MSVTGWDGVEMNLHVTRTQTMMGGRAIVILVEVGAVVQVIYEMSDHVIQGKGELGGGMNRMDLVTRGVLGESLVTEMSPKGEIFTVADWTIANRTIAGWTIVDAWMTVEWMTVEWMIAEWMIAEWMIVDVWTIDEWMIVEAVGEGMIVTALLRVDGVIVTVKSVIVLPHLHGVVAMTANVTSAIGKVADGVTAVIEWVVGDDAIGTNASVHQEMGGAVVIV